MDMFSSDSNFYEIGTSDDLKALWDADLEADPLLGSFRSSLYEAVDEWALAEVTGSKSQVVIHDRLMSDAALATVPIKTEHSYSYPMPDSPCSLVGKMDSDDDDDDEDENMEGERFQGTSQSPPQKSRSTVDMLVIKEEPASDTDSMDSFSMSPDSPSSSTTITSSPKTCRQQEQQSILKKSAVYLDTSSAVITHSRPLILPKLEIKVEPATTGFSLPPTPPSSTSSDNEGGVSQDVMDTRLRHYRRQSTTRVYLTTGSRQPIQSPLISTQMKGITGTLVLTDEEKRTLVAEGYPVPTRLPLSKAEEKALKKIRRKIKNKISAQESRRKKKEYMDCLEKKVEVLTNENFDFKKKIELLEDSNATMLRELKKLQAIVTKDLLGSSSRTIVPQYIASKKDLSGRPSRS